MEKDKSANEVEKEIEILEFRSGGYSYGVDLSDVREILPNKSKLLPIPNAHPYIEGIIKPRDFLIPIVNFEKSLKLAESDEFKTDMLIVSSVNDLNIAFHVDSVRAIHKILPSAVEKPGRKLTTTFKSVVTGVITTDDNKIEIIDFRKIINDINPEVNVG